MSWIQTVCGRIAPEKLGAALIHEHILCTSGILSAAWGDRWLVREQVVAHAVALLRHMRMEYKITAIVDGTPQVLGRDLELLREISERSQVHIVGSSGLYYYDDYAVAGLSAERLAACFEADFTPEAQPAHPVPGMLKCAVEAALPNASAEKGLVVMARVQRRRHLPLYCHTSVSARNAPQAAARLLAEGVAPEKLLIGHVLGAADAAYIGALLALGVTVSCDRLSWSACALDTQIAEIAFWIKQGYARQICLAHDYIACPDGQFVGGGANSDCESAGGTIGNNGFGVIPARVLPGLRAAGVSETEIHTIMIENPARLLSCNETSLN